jgi:putative transposase
MRAHFGIKLKELASQRPAVRLSPSRPAVGSPGHQAQPQEAYRTYKEERLSVRKRALGTRAPMEVPQDRNLRWRPGNPGRQATEGSSRL